MCKLTMKSRLSVKLLAAVLLSLLIAGAVIYISGLLLTSAVDHRYRDGTLAKDQLTSSVEGFREFVASGTVSAEEKSRIDAWLQQKKYLDMVIVRNRRILYDSLAPTAASRDYKGQQASIEEYLDWYLDWYSVYEVHFADGPAKAYLYGSYAQGEYKLAALASILLGGAAFTISLLWSIRAKNRYIVRLRDELRILEGGNLQHPITVQGRDELGDLAAGVESMRLAFSERLECEERARSVNDRLVTEVSHNLRTPLTSLIGYLEMLSNNKCSNAEQRQKYVDSSRRKAYQIKELSDNLFDQFHSEMQGETRPFMQKLSCYTLMDQLLGEGIVDLENDGFRVEYSPMKYTQRSTSGCIQCDIGMLRRGFGNLFGNIALYGCKSEPVQVRCCLEENQLVICLSNGINRENPHLHSAGSGLAVCREMAQRHQGRLRCRESTGRWHVELRLPILPGQPKEHIQTNEEQIRFDGLTGVET